MPRAARRHRRLRPPRRPARRLGRHRARAGHRRHRAQRRRQEHAAQGDPRHRAAGRRYGVAVRPAGVEDRSAAWPACPSARSVDWDFPVSVRDVVLMGRYPHMGLLRRASQADRDAVEESPAPRRHAGARRDADRTAVRRPAAARVHRPGAGAGSGPPAAGRADDRHRRLDPGAHPAGHRRRTAARQDRPAGDPRPRVGLLRLRLPVLRQRAHGQLRHASKTPTRPRTWQRPSAGRSSCSGRPARRRYRTRTTPTTARTTSTTHENLGRDHH